MNTIEFFDANVTLGLENVVPRGRYVDRATLKRRLTECRITGGLAVHNAAVEGDPVDGNALLMTSLHELDGFVPAWSVLPFSTGEMGDREELRRSLAENAVRALLFYPAAHKYSPEEWLCGDLFDLCAHMRMPVFTRMENDLSWDQLARMLSEHPELRVVLRNCSYSSARNLYRLLVRHRHLYIESSRFFPFGGIEDVVRRFGAERLVFGSGAPTYSPGAAITPILTADIEDTQRRLIAGETLRKLIGDIRYDA